MPAAFFQVTLSTDSLASFRRRRGTIRGANGGGYTTPLQQHTFQQKVLSSGSLIHSSPLPSYADREKADGTRHRLSLYPVPQRRKSAAALSAAVDSPKPIGDAPTPQAEPSQRNRPPPNASRSSGERVLGGEAPLSEKRPLPPASPYPRLFRREREGGGFSTEKPPPSQSLIVPLAMPLFAWYHRVDGICAAEGA